MVVARATVSGADGTVWLTVDREGRTSAGLAEAMRDTGFEAGDVVLVVRVGRRAFGAKAS